MASNNDKKYGTNRNLWRKVAGYGVPPRPQIATIADPATHITYSIDLQSTIRHRDYFEVKPGFVVEIVTSPISYSFGEYDEGLIYFDSMTDESTAVFNFSFSGDPYIVLSMEDAYDNLGNVNIFGVVYDPTELTVRTSAPFSGTIRYRAIWAPSYPTIVTSSEPASASIAITASAGKVNASGETFNTTYATLPAVPTYFYDTPWDTVDNGLSNVSFYQATTSTTNASGSISAQYVNWFHFIAQIV